MGKWSFTVLNTAAEHPQNKTLSCLDFASKKPRYGFAIGVMSSFNRTGYCDAQ
jgi:hypothetical protein